MKNILLLLLSLFIVSCSTTSYVREYPETTYFSNLPTVSPTLTIVTYNSPYWTQNYWYSNNIYTNHWPYTNNVYSNDLASRWHTCNATRVKGCLLQKV